VWDRWGPGELGELATAFDQMADAMDRQDQHRRDLVADVAHELRTPIAVLQAEHEALLDGVAEPSPAQFSSLRDQVLSRCRRPGRPFRGGWNQGRAGIAPVDVVGDAGRLHQIVTNLLTNALKFTLACGRVTIDTGPADGQAFLRVSDTGIGIPAAELPRIFDRFWRVTTRPARREAASGWPSPPS